MMIANFWVFFINIRNNEAARHELRKARSIRLAIIWDRTDVGNNFDEGDFENIKFSHMAFNPGKSYNLIVRKAGTEKRKINGWNLRSMKHNGLTD